MLNLQNEKDDNYRDYFQLHRTRSENVASDENWMIIKIQYKFKKSSALHL